METIAYRYGAQAPVENAELVNRQIVLGRQYRNRLIELERDRRQKVESAIAAKRADGTFAALDSAEKELAQARDELEKLRAQAKARNAVARNRRISVADRERFDAAKSRLRAAAAVRKIERAKVWSDPRLTADLEKIEAENLESRHAARASCGVFWGTYLLVEDSLKDARKGAPPEFKRWNSDGKIGGNGFVGVQIQNGMTVKDLESGEDTRLRMSVRGEQYFLSVRIGSNPDRSPVWAKFPISLNRPLPEGGLITWVRVRRDRIGTQWNWHVIFTVRGGERQRNWQKSNAGIVAVELGWRMVESGLRVCRWRGGDGGSGELVLPPELLARWPKSADLQSVRDQNFNAMRDELIAWLSGRDVPAWLAEEKKTLALWRSPERLAKLAWDWMGLTPTTRREPIARFDGDESMLGRLMEWRKQERHLANWQANNVAKAERNRLDLYRNFAAGLGARYAAVAVEDTDWAKLNRTPPVEEGPEDGALRHHFRHAAVGTLIECLANAMRKIEVPAGDTTRTCVHCGHVEAFDARAIHRICGHCGQVDDQDDNAAAVILARAVEMEGDAALARGPGGDSSYDGTAPREVVKSNDVSGGARGGRWKRMKEKKLAEGR